MLEKLLEMISTSGTRTPASLAQRLGVSQGLVEQMLEHLERLGYLKLVDGCNQRACKACGIGRCGVAKPRLWVVRGERNEAA